MSTLRIIWWVREFLTRLHSEGNIDALADVTPILIDMLNEAHKNVLIRGF